MKSFIYNDKEYNGSGRQLCNKCAFNSISGMMKKHGLCPFHYAAGQWGKEWAEKCYPDYSNAIVAYIWQKANK